MLNLDNLIVRSAFKFQELLDSCVSLKFLRIMAIDDMEELNFPKSLTSFSCLWWIYHNSVLQFSEELVSFDCNGAGNGTVLGFSENLKSFSYNEMLGHFIFKYPENTPLVSVKDQLELPEGLNFLTMDCNLEGTVKLPEKLVFLSCEQIKGKFKLITSEDSPVNLKTLHCQSVDVGAQGGDVMLPDSLEEFICGTKKYPESGSIRRCFMWFPSKLLKFSSGNIRDGVVLSLPAGLLSFSIGDVDGDDTFDFPDGIPQLEVLEYGKVEGDNNRLMIQKLKENMKKPE